MTADAASVGSGDPGRTRDGVVLLLASGISIAAWMTHLVSLASLVDLSERHAGVVWVMHGLTAVTALTCIGVIALGAGHARRAHASETDPAAPVFNYLSRVSESTKDLVDHRPPSWKHAAAWLTSFYRLKAA